MTLVEITCKHLGKNGRCSDSRSYCNIGLNYETTTIIATDSILYFLPNDQT